MYTASAFTAVSARRTLGGQSFGSTVSYTPQTTIPTTVETPPVRRVVWPQTVRDYVQRCFAAENAIPGITTEEMQAKLKQVINEAAERSALHDVDWPTIPLPQALIQHERAAAFVTQSAKPWRDVNIAELNLHDLRPRTDKINPKKRKSLDLATEDSPTEDASSLTWRTVTSSNVLEDRITHAEPKQSKRSEKRQRKAQEAFTLDVSKSTLELEKRRQRFNIGKSGDVSPVRFETPEGGNGPVVGTCQILEKRYFRLTSAPKPESVRPLGVLEKAFAFIINKWKTEHNYGYTCDQLKSIRQDLTVQRIKNGFTVNVYQRHARIALELKDLGEYNQCQTQLRALYRQNLGGKPNEFLAYRILYFIYTNNRTDMSALLAELTDADRKAPEVQHALEVRSALALGNYHRFFALARDTPNMGSYLIEMFLARERLAALARICKG